MRPALTSRGDGRLVRMRLRGPVLYRTLGRLLESDDEKLTPSVVWNVKRGIGVSADEYLMAEEQRSRIGPTWRISSVTTIYFYAPRPASRHS